MADCLTLFEAPTVHVFSLPPSDFLCSDAWEGNYIWSGTLRFVRQQAAAATNQQQQHHFVVRLLEKDSSDVFGECPVRDASPAAGGVESVQPATDSTRAFVLRVEDGEQFSYVGLMFDDRNVADNFSSALIHRRRGAGPAPVLTVHDHSLERGDVITVDLFNKVKAGAGAAAGGRDALATQSAPAPHPSAESGELPRVRLASLQTSTAGRSRRVKITAESAAAATAASRSAAAAASPSTSSANAADDIFGTAPRSSAAGGSNGSATAASAPSIDDVFGGGAAQPKAAAPASKQDLLDSLFG